MYLLVTYPKVDLLPGKLVVFMSRATMARTVLIAQHKPISYLSPSTAPKGSKRFAIDLLTHENRQGGQWSHSVEPRLLPALNCAGRLDADSSGLMLWTNDNTLMQSIIRPNNHVDKECESISRCHSYQPSLTSIERNLSSLGMRITSSFKPAQLTTSFMSCSATTERHCVHRCCARYWA